MQKFAPTTVTPTQTKVTVTLADALKNGAKIVITVKREYGDWTEYVFTGTYNNGEIKGSTTSGNWFKQGYVSSVSDNTFTYIAKLNNATYISITFDTANNSYTLTRSGNGLVPSQMKFLGINVNSAVLPINNQTGNGTVSAGEGFIYKITINNQNYSVEFDSSGNISKVNDTALNNGKVTLNGTEYTFSGTKDSITYEEVPTEITKTATLDGVEVTLTFDSEGNLTKVEGTGVTFDEKEKKFTITKTDKIKTYTAALDGDKVKETLESATYTNEIDGVKVTFNYDNSGNLQSVKGTGVTFEDGKFTIGNKTYSASLSNNKVTEKLEQTIYTATVDDVEVTFTYNNISGKFTSVKGKGVTHKNKNITVGDKTYTFALDGDEISITDPHLFENDEDKVKILATSKDDTIKNSGNDVSINAKGGNNSITNSGENVKIVGGTGKDTIENTAQNVTISGSIGSDSIKNDGASVSISGGSGNDTIENSAKNVTISAGEGNDSIYNDKSNVSIHGGGGKDTINNYKVEVTIDGGYGDDSITNNSGLVSINGGGGHDTITSTGDLVTILGGSGEDLITNTGDRVYIDGGIGNDKIVNNGGAATIFGGSGNDEITGGSQSDSIVGSFGDDTLNGGAGDDILTGGLGKDLFIYESGNDTITDYAAGDKISLSSGSISETSFDGKDVIFKIGNGSLTVKDGKGKQIAITDSSGNTTRQIYKETETNAKMFDLIQDNNFVTDEFAIDDISKSKFEVTQIQTKETEELKQPEITFTDDK